MNTATTATTTTTIQPAIRLYFSKMDGGSCFIETAQQLGRVSMSKAVYAACLNALQKQDLSFKYEDSMYTVRAEVIPVIVKPDSADRNTVVRVIREGSYYPGRMGDPTMWKEIEITHDGQKLRCFMADKSGYEGDDTWLSLECDDEDEVEWYEEDGEEDEKEYGYELITGEREDFRHVRDVLIELKEEGSVNIK